MPPGVLQQGAPAPHGPPTSEQHVPPEQRSLQHWPATRPLQVSPAAPHGPHTPVASHTSAPQQLPAVNVHAPPTSPQHVPPPHVAEQQSTAPAHVSPFSPQVDR